MERQLTKREIKAIKDYGLHPKVEQKVWDVWSQNKKPNVQGWFLSTVSKVISIIILFSIIAVLWVNYFAPEIANLEGFVNIGVFFFWTFMPLALIVTIIQLIMILKDEENMFKAFALNMWRKKSISKLVIARINFIALMCALF